MLDDVDDTDSIGIGSNTGFIGGGGTLSATDIQTIRSNATFVFSNAASTAGLAAGDITDIRNAFDITNASFNPATNELTINWTFDNVTTGGTAVAGLAGGAVGNIALNFLAADETLVVTFPVTITDGTTPITVNVPITFTGTNDVPTGTQTRTVYLNEEGGDARFTALAPGGSLVDNNPNAGVDNGFATGVHRVVVDGGTLSDNQNFRIAYSDGDRTDVAHTLAPTTVAISSSAGSADGLPTSAAALGWFAANLTQRAAGGSGQINWTLTAPDAAFQFLGAGDTMTLVYQLNVLDNLSESTAGAGRTVTVTVTGKNDGFDVTAGSGDSFSGAVTEGPILGMTVSDTLTVTDVDLADVHTASVQSVSVNLSSTGTDGGILNADLLGMIGVSAGDITAAATGSGQLTWTFTANETFDHLADGETLVLDYVIRVTDDNVSPNTVDKTVTITITGTNDKPSITAIDVDGAVTEDATTPNLSTAGSISFNDLDATDTSTVAAALFGTPSTTSAAPIPQAVLDALAAPGAFALSGAGTAGAVHDGTTGWDFTLANSLVQYLNEGETITVTYRITVADDSGTPNASNFRDVTITITGTNDGPTANADVNGLNAVVEAGDEPLVVGDATATGNVLGNDTDPDATADLDVVGVQAGTSMVAVSGNVGTSVTGIYGSISIAEDGAWTYTLSDVDPQTNALAAGETATDTFTYTIEDDHGAQSTTTITITINGSNDGPVIDQMGGVASGTITENDALPTNTPPSVSGSFTFSDADTSDRPGSGTADTVGAASLTFAATVSTAGLTAPQIVAAQALANSRFSAALASGATNNGTINWGLHSALG